MSTFRRKEKEPVFTVSLSLKEFNTLIRILELHAVMGMVRDSPDHRSLQTVIQRLYSSANTPPVKPLVRFSGKNIIS